MTTPTPIRPVILCGGNGKRLWPVSRKSMPKQFARLAGEHTMLQDTIRRLEDAGCDAPILVTNEDYRFTVAAQAEEIGTRGHRILVEPALRNTAAAIAAAAALVAAEDADALILVAPSDHRMGDVMAFSAAVAAAAQSARDGALVTFGIRPDRAETGYGYIELDAATAAEDAAQPYLRFVEKPDADRAAAMLAEGRWLWNSGLFLFTARAVLAAFAAQAPAILAAARGAVQAATADLDFLRLGAAFLDAPDMAFDHAVMERSPGRVVPLSAGWSDLGSWRSVWENSARDGAGVAVRGAAEAQDCADTLLFSDDEGVRVVGLGLRNIAAVATRDAVLVADLDCTQSLSALVTRMATARVPQAETFPRHARPWGHYETLSLGNRFQVKSIVVKPGGKLSLQSHVHRAEHWVVVEGTATVTIGTSERLVSENQSVYIPLGEVHRLANTGKVPLQLIEVQTGAYLGEDDIVRYEDIYARA
jgi:mannose-1-phosphate guanylyltransferase/mannose-6-phosphate isomerase